MMRFILPGILVFGIIIIAMSVLSGGGNDVPEGQVVVGYCPTMAPIAHGLILDEKSVLVEYASTAIALDALSRGNIDVALIGRLALPGEADGMDERMLGSGYTLIGSERRFAQRTDVLLVHTALDAQIVQAMLPAAQIRVHASLEDAIASGGDVLLAWEDVPRNHALIVVMDGMVKAPEFRIPVLYSGTYDIDKIRWI